MAEILLLASLFLIAGVIAVPIASRLGLGSVLGYLIAGWGIPLATLGVYAATLMRRGRALAAQVPADRQRWMTTDSGAS